MIDSWGQQLSESLADVDLSQPLKLDHPLLQGIVGFWLPLPSLSGGSKLYDLTPYGNRGTLTNMDPATDWVNTERGIALDFDGVNDYIDLPDAMFDLPRRTVALWFSANDFSDGLIFSGGAGPPQRWYMWAYGGKLVYSVGDGGTVSVLASPLMATWYHFVVTYDGTLAKAYIDGVERASYSVSLSGSSGVALGAYAESSEFFSGLITDVRICNRALSASEIRWLYEDSLSGRYEILNRRRRWWPVSGVVPSQTILDYERGYARGYGRGCRVGAA